MEYGKIGKILAAQQHSHNYVTYFKNPLNSFTSNHVSYFYTGPYCDDNSLECCYSDPGLFFFQIR